METDPTVRGTDWDRFVAATAAAGGLGPEQLSARSRPFTDGQLDSLAISEMVLFLLEEYGLDLFDEARFAQAAGWSLDQLHEAAWNHRSGVA